MLPRFDYFAPKSVKEACSLLAQYREDARVIAGGTDLLVRMKQKLATPKCLINIKGIPEMDYVRYDNGRGLRIGALATLRSVGSSTVVHERFPMLAQAARSAASTQVRSMGTIGGNMCLETRCWYYNQARTWRLARPPCYKGGGDRCYVVKGGDRCYSLFAGDTVPSLIALGARIQIATSKDERTVPLEEFYTGTGQPAIRLQPEELVTGVQVPDQPPNGGGAFLKYSTRGALDFAIVSVAAAINFGASDSICDEARIVIGAVASAPIRTREAEAGLQGKRITDEAIERAAATAMKEAGPVVYIGTPVDYKRRMIGVLVRRAIVQASGLAR